MLCIFALVASVCAEATELRLYSLSLPYASPWQRGAPEQEAEDDALLLDTADIGLQLAVMRHTRVINIDTETYFGRLTRSCRLRQAGKAKTFRPAAGGPLWLVCLRTTQAGSVFHLSTLFDRRAYSLVLFAPPEIEQLPVPALDLLARLRLAAAPDNIQTHAPAPLHWRHTRTLFPQADAGVLAALVQNDRARLGDDGMLTGYGLDYEISGLAWFIEGYQWQTFDARPARVEWRQGGRLEFELASASSASVNTFLRLDLVEDDAAVSGRLTAWQLCGPDLRVEEALEQLQHGEQAAMLELSRAHFPGCPESGMAGDSVVLPALSGRSGQRVEAEFAVPLPLALDAYRYDKLRQAGLTRIGLLEIALQADPRRVGFGDRLIEHARSYVVFEQESR